MTLRVLRVPDHLIPQHSGYTFRTLSRLCEQIHLGWQAFHLTDPKQRAPSAPWWKRRWLALCRTLAATAAHNPGMAEVDLIQQTQSWCGSVAHCQAPYRHALPQASDV